MLGMNPKFPFKGNDKGLFFRGQSISHSLSTTMNCLQAKAAVTWSCPWAPTLQAGTGFLQLLVVAAALLLLGLVGAVRGEFGGAFVKKQCYLFV